MSVSLGALIFVLDIVALVGGITFASMALVTYPDRFSNGVYYRARAGLCVCKALAIIGLLLLFIGWII